MMRQIVCLIAVVALVHAPTLAAAPVALGGMQDLTQRQPGRTMRSSTSDPDWHNGNADARHIPPGETLLLADLEGPGVIRHLWNTIAADERGYSRLLVLRMYWDGEEQPSVEVPIGDFFGIGHGVDQPYVTLPFKVSSEGRARNCYWPMPFRKSARITVTNEGRRMVRAFYSYVDWQKLPELPEDTVYFHAMYRQEYPTVMEQNYLIAEIEGRGHYVGTLLSIEQLTPGWYGEGDDFFFIDGEEEPSLRGTGTEDYFCDAWGFRQQDGPFYGIPLFEGLDTMNRTSAYRWHIPDPVVFEKSLRVEIEHKGVAFNEAGEVISGFTERADNFSSVAYWYQTEPHKPFPTLPAPYDRLSIDYENMLEAEQWLDTAETDAVAPTEQEGGGWSDGGQVFWTPKEPDKSLTLTFEVAEAGTYNILLVLTHSYDYGIFEWALDGQPLGKPLDLYNASIAIKEHYMDTRELDAGKHTISVNNMGKSPESDGYYFGFDGMILSPK
jgi:hypothetical protein